MALYDRIFIGPGSTAPASWTPAQHELNRLLLNCAEVFAAHLRAHPEHELDAVRQPYLVYGRGLGQDEASTFLQAWHAGLIEIKPDSNFLVPKARACSPHLHLLSRLDRHFRVNTEVLIHVGAYGELILKHGWQPERLIFDPFFSDEHLDLWGFAEPPLPNAKPSDGHIIFVAEAKARIKGSDSLSELRTAFERLQRDPAAKVNDNHRHKWEELVEIVRAHGPVEMLLMADGARWWYTARPHGSAVRLDRLEGRAPVPMF